MKILNLSATYTGDIPPRSTEVVYCGASVFRDACYQLVSSFLLTYITFSGLLTSSVADPSAYLAQMSVISIIVIICRIWDGINDPIMGWIIEKFHFKWGKYKPWILLGGILNTIVVLTLFLAHPTGWGFVALFGVFYFLWDIVWTINDIAYWSMLPSLTTDEKRRNNITTAMQICISVGVFAVYGAVPLLVGAIPGFSSAETYGLIAIVVTTLYLISQIVLVLVCKEHDRREETIEEKENGEVRFRDIFRLFGKNDQFRWIIIAILLNYLAAGTLVAFGMYYFYLNYGYGSDKGGNIQFIFTVMYAIGTLIAQFLYPLLTKLLSRKQMLLASGGILIIGYLAMLFLGFPLFSDTPVAYGSLVWLLYVPAVFIFFAQGIIAVVLIVQLQSTIEYNEYNFGERKEALVSSMRALVAKWGSAIQQGLVYATLAATGLYAVTSRISDLEYINNDGGFESAQEFNDEVQAIIDSVSRDQKIGMAIGMIIVPLAIMLVSVAIASFVFKIDERKYNEMVAAINERKKKDSAAV